jgi:hypothetical protein
MIEFSNSGCDIPFNSLELDTLYTDGDGYVCFLAKQYNDTDIADTCIVYLYTDNTMAVVPGPNFPESVTGDVYQLYNGQVNIYNGIVG